MRHFAVGVLVVLCSSNLLAQRVAVQGRVMDGNGVPVAFANVFAGKQGRIVSDDSGAFLARVPTGAVWLELRRLGYQPVVAQFDATRDTAIEIVMLPIAQGLPEERVTASAVDHLSRRGFYDRMRDADRGLVTGFFVTAEDIEARRPFRTSQMLESVPGVRLLATGGNNVIPVGAHDCRMAIYLDGVRLKLNWDTSAEEGSEGMSMQRLMSRRKAGSVLPGESFDGVIGLGSVAGIEIYPRGTRAPAMFQTLNATCGIIAVWTK
jgi:hypothetical protein